PNGREPSGGIQDWTLSADGNSLFAFLGIENALLRIDLNSNTAFCLPGTNANLAFTGTVGAQTDEFGGMYFDDNILYGWQVDRGRLFSINTSTAQLSLVASNLPLDVRGDNATCLPCQDESTITVCPDSTTTYSVVVTDANGCSSSTSVTVVVRNFENVHIEGDGEICYGERSTLTAPIGTSYLWSSGQTTQSITVSPIITTTYTVTITRPNQCDGVGNFTILVNQFPNISIEGKDTICAGECTQLLASGGFSYAWSGNGIQANNALIEICPTETSMYMVTVSSELGCSTVDSINIFVKDTLSVLISGNNSICLGETTSLNASGGVSYIWNTGETTTIIHVSPLTTTTYTVTATGNTNVCEASGSFVVQVYQKPDIIITGRDSICEGECTRLQVESGFFSYIWSGSAVASNDHFIEICPSEDTEYTVIVTDDNGCTASTSNIVFVGEKIIPSITGITNICVGEQVVLEASGGTFFLWNTGQTSSSITVSPTINTTYSVTVTNGGICKAQTSIAIEVNSIPNVNINGNNELCLGECTELTVTGGTQYLWSGPGFSSTESVIEICPEETGIYFVTVTDGNGCSKSQSVEIKVNIPAILTITGDDEICEGDSTRLEVLGGLHYTWSTGETTTFIVVKPDVSTTYTVTSIDLNGCLTSISKLVHVRPIPNIFIVYKEEICEGTTVNIRANGGEHYLWNTGDTTASINVSPDTSTWYIVTVTNGFNCMDVDSVEIMVKPKPTIVIDGNKQICFGDSATVFASLLKYNKCPDECEILDPVVIAYWDLEACKSVVATGTHLDYSEFVPVTFTGECLEITTTNVRRIQGEHSCSYGPSEADIAMCISGQSTCNSTKVDYTQTLRFSVTVRPGQTGRITGLQFYETSPTNFQWVMGASGPNNYYQKYLLRIKKDGQIVYYKDEITSERAWHLVSHDFSNNNHFAFSKETEFEFELVPYCPVGNGAAMSVWDIDEIKVLGGCCESGNHGDISYLWSNGSTQPGFKVSPEITTKYTVTVTDCCGCTSSQDFEVRVNNMKVDLGPDVMIEEGQSITIRPTITGNSICPAPLPDLNYKWSNGSTLDSILVSPAISYVYGVTVTDCMECKGSGRKFIFVNPGINRVNVVYPNPTAGKFQVLNFDKLDDNTHIHLYMMDGKLVGSNEIPYRKITEFHLEVDLPSHIQSGMYILEINNNGIITRSQIVVIER
ncbi:MAG: T9SS type A sorting domain-containing protein, partial [Saprospiraceae bacterium]